MFSVFIDTNIGIRDRRMKRHYILNAGFWLSPQVDVAKSNYTSLLAEREAGIFKNSIFAFPLTFKTHAMALNAFLFLQGQRQGVISGSVTQKGHEGNIEVIAATHEILSPRDAISGLPTGKR
ncbi:MAG: type VI secretion system tube protein Hcp, partial [Bacteroidota bacterium]